MKRPFIAAVLLIVSICAAQAFGLGRLGANFGHLGALGGAGKPPVAALPCDALAAAGTPCVAAHSVTRKLLAGYSGNLFQITRASDSTTANIGTLSSGVANVAAINSFCASTTCTYSIIYDQMHTPASGNNLPAASVQAAVAFVTLPSGTTVPMLSTGNSPAGTIPVIAYRNRASTVGIPTGSNPITEYMVVNTYNYALCCGTYGDMETTIADTGNGHMFALAFGTSTEGTLGTGALPWAGVDWENGAYFNGPQQTSPYISILAKYNTTGPAWELKSASTGDAAYTVQYNGALPSGYSANWEGGLSLGEGGDGSSAPANFFEGVVIASTTTDAADALIQASITSFYGPNATAPEAACLTNNLIPAPLALSNGGTTPATQLPWSIFSNGSTSPSADPFGNYFAALLTSSTGSEFSGLVTTAVIPATSSTIYTFTLWFPVTSGATVFPGATIEFNGINDFGIVVNTNTGAVVQGTWGGFTGTYSSTQIGAWWKAKVILASPSGSTQAVVFVSPPVANSSGVRSNQTPGLSIAAYCPSLTLGSN